LANHPVYIYNSIGGGGRLLDGHQYTLTHMYNNTQTHMHSRVHNTRILYTRAAHTIGCSHDVCASGAHAHKGLGPAGLVILAKTEMARQPGAHSRSL